MFEDLQDLTQLDSILTIYEAYVGSHGEGQSFVNYIENYCHEVVSEFTKWCEFVSLEVNRITKIHAMEIYPSSDSLEKYISEIENYCKQELPKIKLLLKSKLPTYYLDQFGNFKTSIVYYEDLRSANSFETPFTHGFFDENYKVTDNKKIYNSYDDANNKISNIINEYNLVTIGFWKEKLKSNFLQKELVSRIYSLLESKDPISALELYESSFSPKKNIIFEDIDYKALVFQISNIKSVFIYNIPKSCFDRKKYFEKLLDYTGNTALYISDSIKKSIYAIILYIITCVLLLFCCSYGIYFLYNNRPDAKFKRALIYINNRQKTESALNNLEYLDQTGFLKAKPVLAKYYYDKGVDELNLNHRANALSLFEKAAQKGSVEATSILPKCYYDQGIDELNLDHRASALSLFEKASQKGSVEATIQLGILLAEGGGFELAVRFQEVVHAEESWEDWVDEDPKAPTTSNA